tara:strand:+ start:1379 stop:1873 length:495 start_codon:yes stop_codon:yes gene_type:complete
MTNKKDSPAKIIGIVSKALKYGPKIVKAIKKAKKVTPKKTDVKLVTSKTKKPKVTKPKVTKTKTTTTSKKTTGKVDKRSKAWKDETKKLREEMEAKYAPKQSTRLERNTKRMVKATVATVAGAAGYTYFGSKKSKLKRNEVNIPQPKENTYEFVIPKGTKFKNK